MDSKKRLSKLIDTYQNLVFSICLKMTNDYFVAEDLTQETFLSAYRNLELFDGCNEMAWICRIATNKCIDYQKKAERKIILSEDMAFAGYLSKEGVPEKDYIEKEVWEELSRICSMLRVPYDTIARMYFVEEMCMKEIAEVLGKNVKTVQTQIYRARAMLRKIYEKERQL